MKKQHGSIPVGVLFIAVCGFVKAAHSYDLPLMMAPILAGAQQGTGNVIGWQPLNDTGITWGGDYPSGNNTGCTGEEIGAQDCSHGRDTTHDDDTDGLAGFSYTKLDSNGEPLANQAANYADTPWECVQDNVTGLIWEVKTDNGWLHDKDDTYTWYNSDATSNGGADGDDGAANNTCYGYNSFTPLTYCNTDAYVPRVNLYGWCGASDWRMPTLKELESLVNFGRSNPAIDTDYFPNTVSSYVWSASPYAVSSDYAWCVYFSSGYSYINARYNNYAVRLVRGGQ